MAVLYTLCVHCKIEQMRPTASQRKKLYALLHAIVRLRDGPRCLRHGGTDRLQMSHIYPKGRHKLMEFLTINVKLLCPDCHAWWHANPAKAREWLKTAIPVERQKKLRLVSQTYLGPFDAKRSILGLEQELDLYESGHVAMGATKQKVPPSCKILQTSAQGHL